MSTPCDASAHQTWEVGGFAPGFRPRVRSAASVNSYSSILSKQSSPALAAILESLATHANSSSAHRPSTAREGQLFYSFSDCMLIVCQAVHSCKFANVKDATEVSRLRVFFMRRLAL